MATPRTVRQVMIEFHAFIGKPNSEFSDAERAFKHKLEDLGWQKRTESVETCLDVDATAFLTEQEYRALTEEYQKLA